LNDKCIEDLKKAKSSANNFKAALKQQRQAHDACLDELLGVYQERVKEGSSEYLEKLEQVRARQESLRKSKLTDTVRKKRGVGATPQSVRQHKNQLFQN